MGNPSTGMRTRWSRVVISVVACTASLSIVSTVSPTPSRAQATPDGQDSQESSVTRLIASVSEAQSRIDELNRNFGALREAANKALVDLDDAQSRAEQARRGSLDAKDQLTEAQAAVSQARAALSEISRSTYRNQGNPSRVAGLTGGSAQEDLLDRSVYLDQQTAEKQQRLADVERARTAAANDESLARQTSQLAERTASEASEAEQDARTALEDSQSSLDSALADRTQAEDDLRSARQALAKARPEAATSEQTPGAGAGENYAQQKAIQPESVSADVVEQVRSQVADAAPDVPQPSDEQIANAIAVARTVADESSEEASDPVAQASSIVAAAAHVGATQADHGKLDNPYGDSTSKLIAAFSTSLSAALSAGEALEASEASDAKEESGSTTVADILPKVNSAEDVSKQVSTATSGASIETVIARAESMIGTPYVWGGGDASGPTAGVDGGDQLGFDCSGLVLYAFAAAGISLPHYTGYQYLRGTQIDPSEAKRGDLFFWGPEGSQHVAIYLGNGSMIEAPQAGQNVQISPVRWSGMSAKAVRLL